MNREERGGWGRAGAAVLPRLFAVALAVLLTVPGGAGAEVPASEPVFKPGIPGLKMADVRDHKHLWLELDELQSWESGDRLSVAEYRSKAIEKTALFLGLGGAEADRFTAVASEQVAALQESFRQSRRPEADLVAANARFAADVEQAVDHLRSLLAPAPRHQLFAPDCKKWLYKLAFGPKEAKEAKEAKEIKEAGEEKARAAPPPPPGGASAPAPDHPE
jgi:hypothetical protein